MNSGNQHDFVPICMLTLYIPSYIDKKYLNILKCRFSAGNLKMHKNTSKGSMVDFIAAMKCSLKYLVCTSLLIGPIEILQHDIDAYTI